MAGKKAQEAVVYRVNNILDVSVRDMGLRPILGAEDERQWDYVVKYRGTVLFKGTNLYTSKDAVHKRAAAILLTYFVPENNDIDTLPWIDADNLSPSQARWFISGYKQFTEVVGSYAIEYITDFADVFAVLGDGSTAPFDRDGMALTGDVLDAVREVNLAESDNSNYDGMFATT